MADSDLDAAALATTADDVMDADAPATRVRYVVLASACALAVVTYIHRVGFATASAELTADLGFNDRQVGYLMAAFLIAYGAFEIPWGRIGDRFGVRNPLAVIILGGSLLTGAVALVSWLPEVIAWQLGFLILLRASSAHSRREHSLRSRGC